MLQSRYANVTKISQIGKVGYEAAFICEEEITGEIYDHSSEVQNDVGNISDYAVKQIILSWKDQIDAQHLKGGRCVVVIALYNYPKVTSFIHFVGPDRKYGVNPALREYNENTKRYVIGQQMSCCITNPLADILYPFVLSLN